MKNTIIHFISVQQMLIFKHLVERNRIWDVTKIQCLSDSKHTSSSDNNKVITANFLFFYIKERFFENIVEADFEIV